MSNILEMLKNEKVEWKKLGEVAKISKGKQFNKKDMLENGKHPVINGGIFPSGYIDMFNSKENTITVSQGGASAGFVNFIEEKFWMGTHAFSLIPNNDIIKNYNYSCFNRFLFHTLKMNQSKLQDSKIGTGIPSISKDYLSSIEISLISKETQAEIVKILDTFTELIKELKNELNLRKKQYSYYRDKLLSEDYLKETSLKSAFIDDNKLRLTTLGEIGEIKMCRRILKNQTSEKGEILISASGTIGRTVIFNGEDAYFQDSNIVWLSHNEEIVLNKYLYYLYQIIGWNPSKGGTISRLYNYNLKNIKVILPSIKIQEKIVNILDKFDTLVNDISQGLPKEIDFRTKQYEHYREKLLTFNKD